MRFSLIVALVMCLVVAYLAHEGSPLLGRFAPSLKAVEESTKPAELSKTILGKIASTPSASGKKGAERNVINLYSARKEELTKEVFELFNQKTGIAVALIHDEPGKLISRMESERERPVADVLLTTDAISLYTASKKGLLSALPISVLELVDDSSMRSEDWIAITKRVRVIAYSKERVSLKELNHLSSYKNLSNSVWKGRLAIRSSSNAYNQMFISSMIYHSGLPWTGEWCKGIVSNLARNPQGGDTDQIKAVISGVADIAVVNHYYYMRMLQSNPEEMAKLGVIYPDQDGPGSHINISGAALVEGSPHGQNAIKFIAFLLSPEAQKIFAQKNYEYPILKVEDLPEPLQVEYKFDNSPLRDVASFYSEANTISMQNGWY